MTDATSPAAHSSVLRRLATTVIAVPDPAATARFLAEGLGFVVSDGPEGVSVSCDGDYYPDRPQQALLLAEGPELELVELRFDLADGVAAAQIAEAVPAHGGSEPLAGSDGRLRFHDPNGLPVACGPPAGDHVERLPASGLRPRRMGHANVKVPDAMAGARFWVRALGMWLSEQIGEDLVFLRLGAEHHNLGLRTGENTQLHHVGFEIPGWDSYRPILDHLAESGHQVEFGPGRHGVGRNLFTYLRDPHSGLRIELFADMATVTHQEDPETALIQWRSEDRMSRTLNRWGSAPPPQSFLE